MAADDQRILANPGTIHWVTANMALERGTTTHPVAETGESVELHFLAVWVKQDQQWLLACLQETKGLQQTPGQNRAKPGDLDQLEWMIGQWTVQGTGPAARLSVNWSEDKKYLVQKFMVELPGPKWLHGEQRIVWDPSRKAIRSWVFRSDGGFAESSWSREGDTWIVKTQGTNSSGAKTSAVNLWAPDGPDRCWFKSLRISDGEASTDAEEQGEIILHFQRTEE